ncbi:MAG: hypothetical protein ACE5I5_08710 [Candidatus Heimdallarchaeota archaeon]
MIKTKKKLLGSIILLLCVSMLAASPVVANNHKSSLGFHAKAKGPGEVFWGLSFFLGESPGDGIEPGDGTLIEDGEAPGEGEGPYYGKIEESVVLTKSNFKLHGKSFTLTHEADEDEERWWFEDARASGHLKAEWPDHTLRIRIRAKDTEGGYLVRPTIDEPISQLIVVGLNLDHKDDLMELFDPVHASLSFRGKYDGKKISGICYAFMGRVFGEDTNTGEWSEHTLIILNLWIPALETYVSFFWVSREVYFVFPDPDNPIISLIIPAAKKVQVRVKLRA